MQSLKYGLVSAVGYIILLTVLFVLTACIRGCGVSLLFNSITPLYIVLMALGFLVAFFAGFCYPYIFSCMVANYNSEYPKVTEICHVEKAREIDPFGHARFAPSGEIRLTL